MCVYRGMSGGTLPEEFRIPDEFGVRGGVEKAFMSTTTDRSVAMGYASGGHGATPSSTWSAIGSLKEVPIASDTTARVHARTAFPDVLRVLKYPMRHALASFFRARCTGMSARARVPRCAAGGVGEPDSAAAG